MVYDTLLRGEKLSAFAAERQTTVGTVRTHLLRALSTIDVGRVPDNVWNRLIDATLRRAAARLLRSDGIVAFESDLTSLMKEVTSHMRDDEVDAWSSVSRDEQWAGLRTVALYVLRHARHQVGRRGAGEARDT